MRVSLFSPMLILLIMALLVKSSMLFSRIQQQTSYSGDVSTSSVLVDTAYAKDEKAPAEASGGERREDSKKESVTGAPDNLGGHKIEATKENMEIIDKLKNSNVVNNLSRSEIELLKELSKRREKLDTEKHDLDNRQQVLQATETKIDQKVVELSNLQSQLQGLMKQYDEKENGKIMSLVKIYETMKPKDAAKIFNELEMPVLLKLVSSMKEVKVAPIIASMDPLKAKELSMELAKSKPIE